MNLNSQKLGGRRPGQVVALAFTLIELLTVIAIISLLIGILVPSVSKARDAAKNTKTRAVMKNMGDGLEMFNHENEDELHGMNYPSSKAGDDPTETGNHIDLGSEDMCGAQWIVRYLLGKKLDGYVPARVVPSSCIGTTGQEQLTWYDNPPPTLTEALPRSGPYVEPGVVKLKAPRAISIGPGGVPIGASDTSARYNNPVVVDAFEMPILYYAANSVYAGRVNAHITAYQYADPNSTGAYDPNDPKAGIYNYRDNVLFTGNLTGDPGTADTVNYWDFGGGAPKMTYGPSGWTTAAPSPSEVAAASYSFAYYIMNKDAYQSSSPDPAKRAVVPNRRDQYILISPGKDGRFGTGDDVTNFQ